MHASAGSVRCCQAWLPRSWKRHVTGPSASFSMRWLGRAIRRVEGARDVMTSGPVPAGSPCVTPSVCQTWDGTCSRRAAFVRASLPWPRTIVERAHGNQPALRARREPRRALRREGPTGHEIMEMRMRSHIPRPRVQDSEQAELSAAVVGGHGQGLPGGSGGLEAQGVEAVLRRAGHRAQFRGPRTGDQTRGDGPAPLPWLFQPWRRLGMLARGTLPLLAGMIAVLRCTARPALGDRPAQGVGAAVVHGAGRLPRALSGKTSR